ncbi:MAG: helix-turn-helix transcriptional regulator [Gammaproteobacteria bacterium]|nr:helix-turn-helix transcriptional regulator [Gammaproteobacteria bacterium]
MITNERQYRITRKKVAQFAHEIENFNAASSDRPDVHPRLLRAELDAMRSQLDELRDELKEYEELKSTDPSVISVESVEGLAEGLIKYRISSGLSQRALAKRLEVKEQQIQRYEATRYESASYQRLCEVSRALGMNWRHAEEPKDVRPRHPAAMIVAGVRDQARRDSGQWVFVDMGFSADERSCGIAIGDLQPRNVRYGDLAPCIARELESDTAPLNLLIEAPLSVAFNANGNPTGRSIEKKNGKTRYWYTQGGAVTLLATMHLVRDLYEMRPSREVRLFEGFASFKHKGTRSSHQDDVSNLRRIAWGERDKGRIVEAEGLKMRDEDILVSSFSILGMDLGIPPVVVADGP